MKYTEQEFKFDHIFDFIRYLFSSIFLAPFRFTNELTRKLPYLQQELLSDFNLWAIGINAFLIVTKVISCFRNKNFNPFAGTIPLVAYILSGGVLCLCYFYLQTWTQPNFRRITEEEKIEEKIKHKRVVSDLRESVILEEDEELISDDTLEEIDVTNIAEHIKNKTITTGDEETDNDFIELQEAMQEFGEEDDYNEADIMDNFISNLESSEEDLEFEENVADAIACDKYQMDVATEIITSSEDASIDIDDIPNISPNLDAIDLSSMDYMSEDDIVENEGLVFSDLTL